METLKLLLMLIGAAVTIYFAVFLLVIIGNIIIGTISYVKVKYEYKQQSVIAKTVNTV